MHVAPIEVYIIRRLTQLNTLKLVDKAFDTVEAVSKTTKQRNKKLQLDIMIYTKH